MSTALACPRKPANVGRGMRWEVSDISFLNSASLLHPSLNDPSNCRQNQMRGPFVHLTKITEHLLCAVLPVIC
jgi:hypothetical protein